MIADRLAALAGRVRGRSPREIGRLLRSYAADRYREARARLSWGWAARVRREPIEEPPLVAVDPNAVDHVLAHYPRGREGHYPLGVFGGGWDRYRTPIDALSLTRALTLRFEQGVPWAETDGYERARRRIEAGGTGWKGAETVAELDERCGVIDALYESIATNGYRSQAALEAAAADGASVPAQGTSTSDPRFPDELKLAVGRDGTLVRIAGGKHRLVIARLLDCEAIPAVVIVRHARWEALRAEVAAADSRAALSDRARVHLGHPDLADVAAAGWSEPASAGSTVPTTD